MSRIGKLPIKLPDNVKIQLISNEIIVEGKNGKLTQQIPFGLKIEKIDEKTFQVVKIDETPSTAEKYGLIRSLIENMVIGVSKKFEKKLQIIGVGYKAQILDQRLILNIGYTHPITFIIPDDITINIENSVNLTILGINKEKVGLMASKIRMARPPEPYKGKGIRYLNEIILTKVGKSGKK